MASETTQETVPDTTQPMASPTEVEVEAPYILMREYEEPAETCIRVPVSEVETYEQLEALARKTYGWDESYSDLWFRFPNLDGEDNAPLIKHVWDEGHYFDVKGFGHDHMTIVAQFAHKKKTSEVTNTES